MNEIHEEIEVKQAALPEELMLGIVGFSGCPGDGCNGSSGRL